MAALGPALGLDETLALRVAGAFGGGIARTGLTCGAVTGGIMAIGLKHGQVVAGDTASKERAMALARQFVLAFEEQYGTSHCRELLGADLSDPEQSRRLWENGVFDTHCARYVATAVQLLDDMLGQ